MARRRKVSETFATGQHIHWEVRWVVPSKAGYRILVHDCEHDLSEGLRVYTKLQAAGRRMVTLRSANVGFPPPEKYVPGWITKKVKVEITKGRRKGQMKTERQPLYVEPMRRMNRKGLFWCPYCREMRKFQDQDGFYIDGVLVPVGGLHCPICGVSHRDFHVRKWNPYANRKFVVEGSSRRGKKRKRD